MRLWQQSGARRLIFHVLEAVMPKLGFWSTDKYQVPHIYWEWRWRMCPMAIQVAKHRKPCNTQIKRCLRSTNPNVLLAVHQVLHQQLVCWGVLHNAHTPLSFVFHLWSLVDDQIRELPGFIDSLHLLPVEHVVNENLNLNQWAMQDLIRSSIASSYQWRMSDDFSWTRDSKMV